MPVLAHILVVLAALTGAAVHAQATASAVASCTIVTPLLIQSEGPLAFGTLSVSSAAGGSVTIAPTGERSADGTVVLQPGAWGAAQFRVMGEEGASFVVSLPASCALRRRDGAEELLADGFSSSTGALGRLAAGPQFIGVGATLHVGAGQPVGMYEGTFNVTVAYQ